MTSLLIRITSETATYLLRDLVEHYQDTIGKYAKTRTYLLYLIFMVNCCKNKWRSVDDSFTVSAILIAPPDTEARKRGEMFSCRVGYYRDGIHEVDTFCFPVDKYWAKMLYLNYSSVIGRLENSPFDPIELSVARDIEHLLNIDAIIKRNYGNV